MFCADSLYLKVCSSTTTAVTASTASCGTYKFITVYTLATNTTCTATQVQLTTANEFAAMTASPWNMTIAQGGLLAGAILGAWAVGYAFKLVRKSLGDNSPE